MPKAIIKKYGVTKKAWQVFRASRGAKKAAKKAAKKTTKKHNVAKAGGEQMAKKKGKSGGAKAKAKKASCAS